MQKQQVISQQNENQLKDSQNLQLHLKFNLSRLNFFYLKYYNKQSLHQLFEQHFTGKYIDKKNILANKQPLFNLTQLKQYLNQQTFQDFQNKKYSQIKFDSNFQSGNLYTVFRKNYYQFDLLLENDTNSKGNIQWFYFTVANLPKDIEFTFNILNLMKSDSLFNYGMQPAVLSQQKLKIYGDGWQRAGRSISYYKNQYKRQQNKRFYYTLTFKISTKFVNDILHIAHCFPYTYTTLNKYLTELQKNIYKKQFLKRITIGKSLGNNNIQNLIITQKNQKRKDIKKLIIILARQHPGESQASYVCQGVINFLTSKLRQAEFLRKNYIIKIFPMVNPDGVILGHYRCNLMGYDLNRKWNVLDKNNNFPQVTSIKELISQQAKQRKIAFILDLHGHSKKLNSFFYANPNVKSPEIVKSFPYMCSRLNPQISYQDCTFSIEQQKKKAARVYLGIAHNITYVYTFQASFYGYIKDNKRINFEIQDYRNLGTSLSFGLYHILQHQYFNQIKCPEQSNGIFAKYFNQLKSNYTLLNMGDSPTSGSQSKPDQYQLTPIQLKQKTNNRKIQTQQSNVKIKFHQTISTPFTDKASRKLIKENIKYSSKIRHFQLNRVDSIVPNKFELALQPSKTVQKEKTASLSKQRIRDSIKRRQTEKSIELQRNTFISILNIDNCSQTQDLQQQSWKQSIQLKYDVSFTQKVDVPTPILNHLKNYELKYVSLANNKNKKNVLLKLDMISKPKLLNKSQFKRIVNSWCQTILSFNCKNKNNNLIIYFPSLENMDRQVLDYDSRLKSQFIKKYKIFKSKQQTLLGKKIKNSRKENQKSEQLIDEQSNAFLQIIARNQKDSTIRKRSIINDHFPLNLLKKKI